MLLDDDTWNCQASLMLMSMKLWKGFVFTCQIKKLVLYVVSDLWKFLNRCSFCNSCSWADFDHLMGWFGVAKPRILVRPKGAIMRTASGLARTQMLSKSLMR